VAVPGVFVTNLCKKICFAEDVLVQVGLDPAEILPRLESISSKVAELLEEHFVMLGEIGVDFALDTEGRVWVIEVNGKPDRNLFFALRDEELIKRILARPLEYACYLADQ
jgi:glutathione synthase/RimK-type ligase-like ATP-grasp enzyme